MRLLAPAKVNLSLEVLGRRDDGYHEVLTVLQAVDLCDELVIEPSDRLSLAVEPAGAAPIEGNLVLVAAERLASALGVAPMAAITLRKRIPMAGGLGGGSSDAAAALIGLSRLWSAGRDTSARPELLAEVAAGMGSDVPFFLRGGTALGEGRGDRLTSLSSPVERYAVIVAPRAPADDGKTGRLYAMLTPEDFTDGTKTRSIVGALQRGESVARWMANAFEGVAAKAHAGYSAARAALLAAGAPNVLLSGAGPSVFTLVRDEAEAQAIRQRLPADAGDAFVARLLPAWGAEGYQG